MSFETGLKSIFRPAQYIQKILRLSSLGETATAIITLVTTMIFRIISSTDWRTFRIWQRFPIRFYCFYVDNFKATMVKENKIDIATFCFTFMFNEKGSCPTFTTKWTFDRVDIYRTIYCSRCFITVC